MSRGKRASGKLNGKKAKKGKCGKSSLSEIQSNDNVVNYGFFKRLTFVQLLIFTCHLTVLIIDDEKLKLSVRWWLNQLLYYSSLQWEVWRHLTHALIHLDLLHLLGNIFLQLIFGIPLERKFGSKRAALIFIGGVLGGSLFSACFKTFENGTLGSSGGSYALLAAYAVGLLFNIKRMNFWLRVCSLVILIGYLPFIQVDWHMFIDVDNLAHLGGAGTGCLLTIILLNEEMEWLTDSMKKSAFLLTIVWSSLLVMTNLIIMLNTPWSKNYPTLVTNWQEVFQGMNEVRLLFLLPYRYFLIQSQIELLKSQLSPEQLAFYAPKLHNLEEELSNIFTKVH